MTKPMESRDGILNRGIIADRLLSNDDFREFLKWVIYKRKLMEKVLKDPPKLIKTEIVDKSDGLRETVRKSFSPMEELLYIRGLQESIKILDGVENMADKNSSLAEKYRNVEKKASTESSS